MGGVGWGGVVPVLLHGANADAGGVFGRSAIISRNLETSRKLSWQFFRFPQVKSAQADNKEVLYLAVR